MELRLLGALAVENVLVRRVAIDTIRPDLRYPFVDRLCFDERFGLRSQQFQRLISDVIGELVSARE